MGKVAFDSETALYRAGLMVPPVACWTWAERLAESVNVGIVTRTCPGFRRTVEQILSADLIVGQNVAYELTGIVNEWPDLVPLVWRLLNEGRISDIGIRERLLNLATHGKLDMAPNPDGSWSQQNYSLEEMERAYSIDFGVDRKGEKSDEDAWRNHYELLMPVPLARWPAEAVDYAKRDALGTLYVHDAQDDRAAALRPFLDGLDPLATEWRQVKADFSLRLSSVWGSAIDERKRDEIREQLTDELAPDKVQHLLQAGILIPPVPPRQRKNGTWTKGDPKEHIKEKPLHALVVRVCRENGIKVKLTPSGQALAKEHGYEAAFAVAVERGLVSTDKEVMETLAGLDETLDEHKHRQGLQKIVQEIERMTGPVAYTRYDVLKETGRTSAKAMEGIPSSNFQNKPAVKKLKGKDGKTRGEINVRNCFVARRREFGFPTDNVFCSVDYSSLEFVSMAQVCYRQFGYSVMRDLLNSGIDPHAYLGGQLALHLDEWFRAQCASRRIADDKSKVYEFFVSLKVQKSPLPVVDAQGRCTGHIIPADLYEKFRKLAKPVGFGYPGGLGAKKFISFAKSNYETVVSQEEAEILKEIWFSTYPEMEDYFRWITTECIDPNNSITDEESGKTRALHRYVTHLGLIRSGATYTAACNGALLQAPAAEGAKEAVCDVTQACYDPTLNSVLYGCRMVAFVHDEIILEMPDDDIQLRHARAFELARLMIQAMRRVMPDVVVKAEPALFYAWDKKAQKVLNAQGLLEVWHPEPEKKVAA